MLATGIYQPLLIGNDSEFVEWDSGALVRRVRVATENL